MTGHSGDRDQWLSDRQETAQTSSTVDRLKGVSDSSLTFARRGDNIAAEAALDGLYIIRTCVTAQRMDSATCVRTDKSPAQVERAFRSMKTMDLKVRPIHHHLEGRVRAHTSTSFGSPMPGTA